MTILDKCSLFSNRDSSNDLHTCDEVSNFKSTDCFKNKYLVINKVGVQYNNEFEKVHCNDDSSCCNYYISHDPRLLDVKRNILTKLDRPPLEGDVKMKDVYNDEYKRYGNQYKNYIDINTGQIQYYIDNDLKNPFYYPVYDIPSSVIKSNYYDPMTSFKPQYNKSNCIDDYSCLSWINDSSKFREDIISKQQRTHNEQKYESYWF